MKLKPVNLKNHPVYNEKWLQDQIAEDPSILGLGSLSLRAKEKVQSSGGRLDLLLEDPDADTPKRYECELQLGATDESHIIRTIEYWDLERKRYPQYDHTAVLVAGGRNQPFFECGPPVQWPHSADRAKNGCIRSKWRNCADIYKNTG